MNETKHEFKISIWLAEFSNPEIEKSYQRYFQRVTNRQLRISLSVWMVLNLVFAVPDYGALGASEEFFYLLTFRAVVAVALFIIVLVIRYNTNVFCLSYVIAAVIIASFSGFMLLFIYRPEINNWTVVTIMMMIIVLPMFIPIRFFLAFIAMLYGVLITLITRFVLGSSRANLIGLFFLLMLPFVVGIASARRIAFSQRKQFAMAAKTAKINEELEHEIKQRLKLEAALKELAATDPLTGLYNRREYETLFLHEIKRARRTNKSLSICIADIDHFKKVNDTYGHGVGDEVLRRTAQICRENIRAIDIIGRLGGEEFVILFPETAVEEAADIGRRLLKVLAATDVEAGSATINITATIGIAQLLPEDRDLNAVIQRADDALYRGKEAGRNRVEIDLR